MGDEAIVYCIRLARIADAEQIAICLQSLGYGASVALVEEKLAAYGEPTDTVFVAGEGARIVGVVAVHLTPLFHAPGSLGRVMALSVRDGHQRRGIGKALMAAAEQWAWIAGAVRLDLTSGNHRPEAHRFYESLGYSTDSRRFVKSHPIGT